MSGDDPGNGVLTACSCRKTGCLKMYCVCFQMGRKCTPECTCQGCKNNGTNGKEYRKAIARALRFHGPEVLKMDVATRWRRRRIGCCCTRCCCRNAYCRCFRYGMRCDPSRCRCGASCQNPWNAWEQQAEGGRGGASSAPRKRPARRQARRKRLRIKKVRALPSFLSSYRAQAPTEPETSSIASDVSVLSGEQQADSLADRPSFVKFDMYSLKRTMCRLSRSRFVFSDTATFPY